MGFTKFITADEKALLFVLIDDLELLLLLTHRLFLLFTVLLLLQCGADVWVRFCHSRNAKKVLKHVCAEIYIKSLLLCQLTDFSNKLLSEVGILFSASVSIKFCGDRLFEG